MVKFILRDKNTGRVKVNLGDRLTKYAGEITTAINQAGSVVVPGSDTDGQVWFTATSLTNLPMYYGYLDVTVTGSTISWSANSSASYLILYGRF